MGRIRKALDEAKSTPQNAEHKRAPYNPLTYSRANSNNLEEANARERRRQQYIANAKPNHGLYAMRSFQSEGKPSKHDPQPTPCSKQLGPGRNCPERAIWMCMLNGSIAMFACNMHAEQWAHANEIMWRTHPDLKPRNPHEHCPTATPHDSLGEAGGIVSRETHAAETIPDLTPEQTEKLIALCQPERETTAPRRRRTTQQNKEQN